MRQYSLKFSLSLSSDSIISILIDNKIESSSKSKALYSKKTKDKKSFHKNRKCFSCGSTSHLKFECDKIKSKNNYREKK